jgi:polyphenol oxidase
MRGPVIVRSALLSALPGVRHGFFARHGGVSRGVYDSLNVGLGSGDDADDVLENRRRAADAFGAPPERLATCYQVHSARVVIARGPLTGERPEADGVVTDREDVLCGALAADCAPVLIADAAAGIVAAVHAGWRGALGGVVQSAVEAMSALGAAPERMAAAVGPCIAPASYEVGAEFMDRFVAADAAFARHFTPGQAADKRQFDLPGFVLARLEAAGVARSEWIGRDTCAEDGDFFSNRRAFHRGEADYGRLLSVIALGA